MNVTVYQKACKPEYLASIDDQVAQTLFTADKFADDDTHQAKTDVDFHHAQDERNRRGKDDLYEGVLFCAPARVNQLQLFFVYLLKSSVEIDDSTKYRN